MYTQTATGQELQGLLEGSGGQPVYGSSVNSKTSDTSSSSQPPYRTTVRFTDTKGKGKGKGKASGLPGQKNLAEVVVASPYTKYKNPSQKLRQVVRDFNAGQRSIMTTATRSGKRVAPGKILLVHNNYIVEAVLSHPEGKMLRRKWNIVKHLWDNDSGYIGEYDTNTVLIGAYGKFIINVPAGSYLKAYLGAEKAPVIYGEGTHVVFDNNFTLAVGNSREAVVSQSAAYIAHSPLHIIRVPKGKLAPVTIDGTQYLLDGRDEPYVFDSATFKMFRYGEGGFVDANQQLIEYGSLTKVIPLPGEVGVAYDNGKLALISKPVLVNTPMFKFERFLQTNIQQFVFPSQEAQTAMKAEENKNYMYEPFRTCDGLEVGVKLLVTISINEPAKLINSLRGTDVKSFIENIVVTSMGNVIQHHSSAEFQKPSQSVAPDVVKGVKLEDDTQTAVLKATQKFFNSLQDEVTAELKTEFAEVGIELHRMNIETAKVLDEKIAHEISEFAVQTTKVATQVALLSQEMQTQTAKAKQDAAKQQIAAQGKLEAAEIALKEQQIWAGFYAKNPEMLKLKQLKLATAALAKVQGAYITPENFSAIVSGGFFAQQQQLPEADMQPQDGTVLGQR